MALGLTGVFQDILPRANSIHMCGLLNGVLLGG